MQIRSCFGDMVDAEMSTFSFSLGENKQWVEFDAAVCERLIVDSIFPSKCLKMLEARSPNINS